jgi:hypothetical protein
MKINKSILGVTGEYYVAAELGKRNVYAQLTLGNQKKSDLLIFSEENENFFKIEVKNKQGSEWPNCIGINQINSFIVFVDFQNLKDYERPIFYILTQKDWSELVKIKEAEYNAKYPARRTFVENNVLILLDEVNKHGKPYRGCGIKPKDVERFKEDWNKILQAFFGTEEI